jgi:hypothetical protein
MVTRQNNKFKHDDDDDDDLDFTTNWNAINS